MMYRKGHVFHGPDGQGYRLTRDVMPADPMLENDLEPFGGAPEPEANQNMPTWLAEQMQNAV